MTFEKREKAMKNLINWELSDYLSDHEYKIERSDYNWEQTIDDWYEYEYYSLVATFSGKKRYVEFKINEEENIFVELCEDVREKTEEYNRTIKYFWMAFLY